MKFALINPPWSYEGSIYFGCQEPHLPLEFGYAKALLEKAGHEAILVDGHLLGLSLEEIKRETARFGADFIVIATAPTYLFWRCPPPELRTPALAVEALKRSGSVVIGVGPHGSVTPSTVLRKLGIDAVFRGEFEEQLPRLADSDWQEIPGLCYAPAGEHFHLGQSQRADMRTLPPLAWPGDWLSRHRHHHHRFDSNSFSGPGAEIESSRGCPFQCTFCAKEEYRGGYRRRPRSVVLAELDHLISQGCTYVYFIDEIFLPDSQLLEALLNRPLKFGIQTRIDLWSRDELELLGAAGCVSVEAGVESVTPEGRRQLNKPGLLTSEELADLLIFAKRHVPFVQANLVRTPADEPQQTAEWRRRVIAAGVWANDPVPLFIYPGSPAYKARWGEPDGWAWERAHQHYLLENPRLCDLQSEAPLSLSELELARGCGG